MGFQSLHADSSLFILCLGKLLVYLLVYVDDIVLTGNSPNFLASLVKQLGQTFELKNLGDLHYFLGLHFQHTSKGLFINQVKYIIDLLTKHSMLTSKLVKTPYTHHVRLIPDEGILLSNPRAYRSLVGSLHYLTFTRLDLSFVFH